MEAPLPRLPDVVIRYYGLSLSIQVPKLNLIENKLESTVVHRRACSTNGPAAGLDTVFQRLLSLPLLLMQFIRDRRGRNNTVSRELKIIDDISGSILPGRLTLLLGAPGSGKSSLLKSLTHRLADPRLLRGVVRYSGRTVTEARKSGVQLGQLVQYISQLDEHSPYLTVRETLSFVANNSLAGISSEDAMQRVQDVIDLLHLNACADMLIGNDLLRGISGGEKKRVTVGEGLITNARFLALDEISTGLDASVTRKIISSLRDRALSQCIGVVVALLQPTPEIFSLFDDVILLRDGAEIYHGPRTGLPGYLRELGFFPPDDVTLHRQQLCAASGTAGGMPSGKPSPTEFAVDLADWLSEWITFPVRRHRKDLEARSHAMAMAHCSLKLETSSCPPFSTEALVGAWKSHVLYATLIASPSGAAAVPLLSLESDYARKQFSGHCVHNPLLHLLFVIRRQTLLLFRNRAFLVFRFISAAFMGTVIGALYYQGGVKHGLNYYGLFLNTVMFLSFCNVGEMSPTIGLKFIGYRQADNGSYPSWTLPVAAFILHLPVALIETLIFGSLVYWLAGLTPEASRFAFYLLIAFTANVFAASTFRVFAYSFPTLIAAQTVPMPIIAVFMLFAGFLITPNKMGWMKFLYYIDPYAYATKSLAQNEFLAPRYGEIPPIGGGKTLGQLYLEAFGLPLDPRWRWGGVAFTVCYAAILGLLTVAAFVYFRFDRNIGSVRTTGSDDEAPILVELDDPSAAAAAVVAPSAAGFFATPLPKFEGGDILSSERSPLLSGLAKHVTVIANAECSLTLPFVPAAIAFRAIVYTVRMPKTLATALSQATQRQLLGGISGYAEPGTLLALMGASGAGKTTLLDVLAGRKNSGVMSGDIYLRGRPKDARTFNRFVAYCEQTDLHMPLTTVLEALETSAALRLPGSVSAAARRAYVADIMSLLELEHLAGRKVGEPGSTDGLAPGERKRLTIGVELCANAPVLFLDEPTSGLDARAAAAVARVLRNVASRGRTIVCTVHQPSYELFSQFDDLLLLQQGGHQVYFGPLGPNCETLIAYLQTLPGFTPCPLGGNPASWMLDMLASATQNTSAASGDGPCDMETPIVNTSTLLPLNFPLQCGLLSGHALQIAYFTSPSWCTHNEKLDALCKIGIDTGVVPPGIVSPSVLSQFLVLAVREWKTAARDVPLNGGRIGALLFLQLLYGIVYQGMFFLATDISGLQSLCAAIFNTNAFAAFINLNAGLPSAMLARPVFYRETSSLMYHPWLYQLAVLTAEIPWLGLCLAIGPTASYFLIGLGSSGGAYSFAVNYLTLIILSLACVLLGSTVANSMPSFEMAQATIGALTPILMLYAGLYSKVSSMPVGTAWIHKVDPIGYAFSVFLPLHLHCSGDGCPTVAYPEAGKGIVQRNRSELVDTLYDVSLDKLWPNIGYLAVFMCIFFISSSIIMRFVRHIVR